MLIMCIALLFIASCQSSGGGGKSDSPSEEPVVNPPETPPVSTVEITRFDVPTTVNTNSESQLQLEIKTDDDSVVFYRINEKNNKINFIPNSGIIVPKKKQGTLIAKLADPDEPGTNNYTLTLTNSQNQILTKTFTITIE